MAELCQAQLKFFRQSNMCWGDKGLFIDSALAWFLSLMLGKFRLIWVDWQKVLTITFSHFAFIWVKIILHVQFQPSRLLRTAITLSIP